MGIKKEKLSEEQKKEVEKLREFVSRNRLNPRMNGTKWRAAIDSITSIPDYQPSFRVKRITDLIDPHSNNWNSNFPADIPLYNSIEWLELNSQGPGFFINNRPTKRKVFSKELTHALTAIQIPIEETPTGIRIIGYARN